MCLAVCRFSCVQKNESCILSSLIYLHENTRLGCSIRCVRHFRANSKMRRRPRGGSWKENNRPSSGFFRFTRNKLSFASSLFRRMHVDRAHPARQQGASQFGIVSHRKERYSCQIFRGNICPKREMRKRFIRSNLAKTELQREAPAYRNHVLGIEFS